MADSYYVTSLELIMAKMDGLVLAKDTNFIHKPEIKLIIAVAQTNSNLRTRTQDAKQEIKSIIHHHASMTADIIPYDIYNIIQKADDDLNLEQPKLDKLMRELELYDQQILAAFQQIKNGYAGPEVIARLNDLQADYAQKKNEISGIEEKIKSIAYEAKQALTQATAANKNSQKTQTSTTTNPPPQPQQS